jgi:hypothetical protein
MTVRGWLATCAACQWNVHALRREHAEAAKRAHVQSTGHGNVTVYPVTKGDFAGSRYAGSDLPQED